MVSDNSKSKEELILENRLLRDKLQIVENLQNEVGSSVANIESDEFRILLEAAINLGSSAELGTLMQEATDKIAQLTNIDTAAIYLLEEDYLYMGGMIPPLDPNFPEDFRWSKLDGHIHILKAIKSKEIVHVHDSKVEELTPVEKIIIENRALRSIWYIPIFTAEETLGVFIIASLHEIQTCTENQLELSRALANLVAIAIQQSLLHKKIEKKNEELRTTLLSIGDGVLSTDLNGNVILMNPVAERLCGYNISEAKGKPVTEIFKIYNPANREQLVDPVSKVLKEGKKVNLANNTILRSNEGKEYQIADSASPILNKDGVISGVVLVFSDVTSDYTLRDALKHSESRLRKAEILGGFGNWEIDLKTKTIIGSPGARHIYGVTESEFNLSLIQKMPLEEFRPKLDKALYDLIVEGKPYDLEFKLRRPDGEIRFVHSNAVYDKEKERIFGIINDITARKEVEAALKKSEERYREFFMKDLTGDFLSSVEGKVLDCNPSFLKILGYKSLKELQLYHATNFYKDPEDRAKLLQKIISERDVSHYEIDMIRSDGEVVNIIENVHGIFDENGNLTDMRGYLFDITYIKKVENDLLLAKERAEDADRLKTEFLAQMSHEIRSPLNAVLSFTGVLEDLLRGVKREETNICFSGIASASVASH
ncbi:MAG: hypothetical protein SCALA702_17490 [Melioribacteraceae bacterium]|nr:MAG: hypothetical protein SCALA702_17490 [Melioribacteraceae bacterium]